MTNVELEEYADYIELKDVSNVAEEARRLGGMCAASYNALLLNAMNKYKVGLFVTQLVKNNLKFRYVETNGPSVQDPMHTVKGYLSWRFKFAAGTEPTVKRFED